MLVHVVVAEDIAADDFVRPHGDAVDVRTRIAHHFREIRRHVCEMPQKSCWVGDVDFYAAANLGGANDVAIRRCHRHCIAGERLASAGILAVHVIRLLPTFCQNLLAKAMDSSNAGVGASSAEQTAVFVVHAACKHLSSKNHKKGDPPPCCEIQPLAHSMGKWNPTSNLGAGILRKTYADL